MDKKPSIKSILSENRSFIMTIAIIWVGVFHFPIETSIFGFHFIKAIGYGGVDIFVFLSGFGLYHSLKGVTHEGRTDVVAFLKKRAARILPSYIPFVIIWMVFKKLFDRIYVTEIFGNLTMSGSFNRDANQFNWYIGLLLLFYMLAPYIFGMLYRSSKPWKTYILLMILAFATGVAFFHGMLLQTISRLPIFITGMLFADVDENHWENCPKTLLQAIRSKAFWIALSVVGFVLMYICLHQSYLDLWHYGLYWYPFLLITPGCAIVLGMVGKHMPKCFDGLGNASFEIYMWHIGIYEFLLYRIERKIVIWIAVFVIAYLVGYLYKKLLMKIRNVIS